MFPNFFLSSYAKKIKIGECHEEKSAQIPSGKRRGEAQAVMAAMSPIEVRSVEEIKKMMKLGFIYPPVVIKLNINTLIH